MNQQWFSFGLTGLALSEPNQFSQAESALIGLVTGSAHIDLVRLDPSQTELKPVKEAQA